MAGAAPGQRTLPQCDLGMKGGITSGVVYPAAIKRLSQDYRLRNVGGASAGAIAATIAAACEYRRRRAEPGVDAFATLDGVNEELTRPHFIQGLFQPTPRARPAFEAALALQAGDTAKLASAMRVIVRRFPAALAIAAAALLLWIAFVAVTVISLATNGVSTLEIVAFVLLGLVSVIALVVLAAAAAAATAAHLVAELNAALLENGLGICGGREMTDWLHATIQRCAGLDANEPLTFAMLKGDDERAEIALRLVSTDLSYSRPVDLPLPDPANAAGQTAYYFSREELAPLFPPAVIAAMTARAMPTALVEGGAMYYRMPGSELPIVVAARLSLSFPILLATVPLWSRDATGGRPVRHTLSDGGISSNFPIHFFDALLPRCPTFGLDLQPYPDPAGAPGPAQDVAFGPGPRPPVFTAVSSVFSFARQILSALLDWRDTMQAELPGFRDRVCQIHLSKREGGLNLDMPEEVVRALEARGLKAGETIATQFDWDCHRFTRYLTFMQVMQQRLRGAQPAMSELVADVPQVPPECLSYPGHEPPWWDEAHPLTTTFLAGVTWGDPGVTDFTQGAPQPDAALRIVPDV